MTALNLTPMPGITDKGLDVATAEFLLVNNIIASGQFAAPKRGQLSQYDVTISRDFSSRMILGREDDTSNDIFIGMDEDLSAILMKLDFSVVLNDTVFALCIKAMGSTFILRVPIMDALCKPLKQQLLGASLEEPTETEGESANSSLDFLAELQQEAAEEAAIQSAVDKQVAVYPYTKPFGADFKLFKTQGRKVLLSFAPLDSAATH